MVKNTQGGSKHKSQARKNANPSVSNNIRYPQEDGECFAKVVKMLGNGMCSVNLVYKDQLYPDVICHIRGKFRSKNKKIILFPLVLLFLLDLELGLTILMFATFLIFIMIFISLISIFLPPSLTPLSLTNSFSPIFLTLTLTLTLILTTQFNMISTSL